jgi:hypothetical protein
VVARNSEEAKRKGCPISSRLYSITLWFDVRSDLLLDTTSQGVYKNSFNSSPFSLSNLFERLVSQARPSLNVLRKVTEELGFFWILGDRSSLGESQNGLCIFSCLADNGNIILNNVKE